MTKILFAVFAVLAALTEIFLSKGFQVEDYKKTTMEILAAEGGTATCRLRS